MKKIFVNHRSPHHSNYSGYDQLTKYIDGNYITGEQTLIPFRIAKFISDRFDQNKGIYNHFSFYKEIKLFNYLRRTSKSDINIVHFLNAERDIRGIFKINSLIKRNTKICATFHKPPLILEKSISDPNVLKRLDGAIVVGRNQLDFVKEWLQLEKVEYVPHGIDTSFFTPIESLKEEKIILFVGQHLRDFDTFNKIASILKEKQIKVKIKVVLRKDFVYRIESNSLVEVLSNLNDETLKTFYQKASLLLLPLHDSTACNSILEAMSCGLPVVTNNIGGNEDYLKGTDSELISVGDLEGMVDSVVDLINNESKRSMLSIKLREKSLQYDWNIISKKIEVFYTSLNSVD